MTRTTRQDEQRNYVYKPASDLSVPDEMVAWFKNKGFHLRWIRATVLGQDDTQNLMSRSREGYSWVTKSELPEEFRDYFQTTQVKTNNQVICVGDLILGKIELFKAKARQEYFEKASEDQVTQAKNTAKKGDDSTKAYDPRMDRLVPLEDDSKTEIELGKRKE